MVFSSQLWQSNLTASHQRREGALQAWESSNRAEAVARLGGLLRERDDLLATLSHELRTPLAGIVGEHRGAARLQIHRRPYDHAGLWCSACCIETVSGTDRCAMHCLDLLPPCSRAP